MPCQYEATDAGFRCTLCGDERPQPVRRRCPVAGDPEPLPMPRGRKFRTPQAVEALVRRYCRPCDAYPCLAEKNCTHADALMMNAACPRGNFSSKPRWVTNAERMAATLRLAAMVPPDVTAVAGVPRSGMTPAAIMAETLHVPLYSIHHADGLRELAHGARLAERNGRQGRLLVVDDTIASGVSMERIRAAMPDILAGHHFHGDAYFAAVYANPDRAELADFVAELLPLPHYLEWNLFNSIHTPTLALDIDGVIFHEERGMAGLPKYVPRNVSVPLIATGRHERDRAVTEEQLHRVGVRYDRLVMAATDEEYGDPATVKARAYSETPAATLFVESCPNQARQIADACGKRVLCPATGEIWH